MKTSHWAIKLLQSAGNMVVILLIIVIVGALIVGVPKFFPPLQTAEIQMGLVVVFAIVCLLALLTVMAAVFSHLSLSDRQQPLGLPEGSIRALIALFLIMIFIIMSVYLFRTIAGQEGVPLKNLTIEEVTQLKERIQLLDLKQNESGTFDVIPKVGVTAAAEQLALQMVTILGTLVTAVSAFYFGSTTAKSAFDTSTTQGGVAKTPLPTAALGVDSITPSSAQTIAGAVDIELTGAGFAAGAQVKLRLAGVADIDATNATVVDASKITCTFDVSSSQTGQWDVVVINPDGRQASKSRLFQIA